MNKFRELVDSNENHSLIHRLINYRLNSSASQDKLLKSIADESNKCDEIWDRLTKKVGTDGDLHNIMYDEDVAKLLEEYISLTYNLNEYRRMFNNVADKHKADVAEYEALLEKSGLGIHYVPAGHVLRCEAGDDIIYKFNIAEDPDEPVTINSIYRARIVELSLDETNVPDRIHEIIKDIDSFIDRESTNLAKKYHDNLISRLRDYIVKTLTQDDKTKSHELLTKYTKQIAKLF